MLPSVNFFKKLPVITNWNDCIKSQVLIATKKGRKQGCVHMCVCVCAVRCNLVYFECFEKHTIPSPQSYFLATCLKMFSKYR